MPSYDVDLSFARSQSLLGGTCGSIPYQTAANTTEFLSLGSTGTVLTSNGTSLSWSTPSSTAGPATPTSLGTVLGYTTGNGNVSIGCCAGNTTQTGSYNFAVGCFSLINNTTGSNNIAAGYQSLRCNTIGSNNFSQGHNSLSLNSIGSNNIAVGCFALANNTTGSENIALGNQSMAYNNIGCRNIGIGPNTLLCNTTGCFNIAIGSTALQCNITGSSNIAIGTSAMTDSLAGNGNIAIGSQSLRFNNGGLSNIAIGSDGPLSANTTGRDNISIGACSSINLTTGRNNIAIGPQALRNNVIGNHNIAQGYQALAYNACGNCNIAIGIFSQSAAFLSQATGCNNVSIGGRSLTSNLTSNNIAIGFCAGCNISTGYDNTVIGSLPAAAGCVCTVLIGAGTCERIKVDNTGLYINGSVVGGGATLSNTTSSNSTFYLSMSCTTSGSLSTAYVSDTKLYFVPCTGTLNATIFNTLSDCRTKENVTNITCALQIVNQLEGVEFTWKDTGLKSAGVIAQQIEEVLPHLVNSDANGNKSVNYQGIIGYLIETVKELEHRVTALESKAA